MSRFYCHYFYSVLLHFNVNMSWYDKKSRYDLGDSRFLNTNQIKYFIKTEKKEPVKPVSLVAKTEKKKKKETNKNKNKIAKKVDTKKEKPAPKTESKQNKVKVLKKNKITKDNFI